MSAQALVTSSVYPIIKSGVVNSNVAQVTNVTFETPFPSGALPLIFIQNTEGSVWPSIIFTTQSLTNTGFQAIQQFFSPALTYQEVQFSYLAVWIPVTPPP